MGTRADFYIGRGSEAEWLGSVAWNGYEWNDPDCDLLSASSPDEFRAQVQAIKEDRDDFTSPEEGWPWPWNDSRITDYAYVLHGGKVEVYVFGRPSESDGESPKVDWFPDMSTRQNVQLSGQKSGLIVVTDGGAS